MRFICSSDYAFKTTKMSKKNVYLCEILSKNRSLAAHSEDFSYYNLRLQTYRFKAVFIINIRTDKRPFAIKTIKL